MKAIPLRPVSAPSSKAARTGDCRSSRAITPLPTTEPANDSSAAQSAGPAGSRWLDGITFRPHAARTLLCAQSTCKLVLPVARCETTAVEAGRVIADSGLVGLVVANKLGVPTAIVSAVDVLRLMQRAPRMYQHCRPSCATRR